MHGSVFKKIFFHLVFVTKYRSPMITGDTLSQLWKLFKQKADEFKCTIHILNGHRDHVHLLVTSPPKLSVSDLVKHLKGYSSFSIQNLQWQRGYGVFTVDSCSFDRVVRYIRKQVEHHGGRDGR